MTVGRPIPSSCSCGLLWCWRRLSAIVAASARARSAACERLRVEPARGRRRAEVGGAAPPIVAAGPAAGALTAAAAAEARAEKEKQKAEKQKQKEAKAEAKTKAANQVPEDRRLGCRAEVLGPGLEVKIINVFGEEAYMP